MPEGYPGDQACWDRRVEWADVDGNGLINTFDIDPFVDVVVSGAAVARVFTWNAENKLVMASPVQTEEIEPALGSQRVSFVYDYMGRRVEKLVETWTDDTPDDLWVPTSRTRYVYDGWLLLLELDAMDGNAVLRQYTWGLDLAGLNGSMNDRTSAGGIGGLLAVHDETVGSGEDYIYFYDANGNVGQLVAFEDDYGDATGDGWHADRLVARYEYDAYGRIVGPDTDADGDWRDDAGPYATINVMRLSTKPWDDELGWGNWGERLYEPRIGRWVSRDPIGEARERGLYGYCGNAPVLHNDATGLWTIVVPLPIPGATAIPVPRVGLCPATSPIPLTTYPHPTAGRVRNIVRRTERVDQPKFRNSRYCRQLRADYKNVCTDVEAGYGGCREGEPCAVLRQKMAGWMRCHEMRSRFRRHCVKSGDDLGHLQAINDAAGSHNRCAIIYLDSGCHGFRPEPIPTETPNVTIEEESIPVIDDGTGMWV